MDFHIDEFFQRLSDETPRGSFHDVIPLHNRKDLTWEAVLKKVPEMPKGWYELARISPKDRIEFTYDHWCSLMPFHPKLEKCLERFFSSLDDIGIYILQNKWEDPYSVQMVYSLSGDSGFYRGGVPLEEKTIEALQKSFPKYILPVDYKAFQLIHDGFWKTTDSTGITTAANLPKQYEDFQALLAKEPTITTSKGDAVNPRSLIPFYESFGMPYFQCFWGEWYPEQEMGNVYYSSESKTISNANSDDPGSETLAFPTFSDWLAFYLERVD